MSDTSGLSNADAEGVPLEEDPARFQSEGTRAADADRDAQAAEPDEDEPGQRDAARPDGAQRAGGADDGAEAPPADFDPAQNPSNPEMVRDIDQPD